MKTSYGGLLVVVACGLSCAVLAAAAGGQEGAGASPKAEPAPKGDSAPKTGAAPVVPDVPGVEAKVAAAAFEEGRRLYFQGKTPEAIERLAQAVAADPSRTSYRLLLAKAQRAAKQDAAAVASFEAILKAEPEHVEAATELAELLGPQKEPDRVIALLQPLLRLKTTYPLYHLLAEAQYRREQFDAARGYFEEAVRLDPRHPEDHFQLGSIHLAQKRFAKAAASFEEAERLGFSSGVFHFKLASTYFNLRNPLGRIEAVPVEGGAPGEIRDGRYLVEAVPGRPGWFHAAGPRSAVYQTAKARQMGIDIFEIRFLEANLWASAGRYAKAETVYASRERDVDKKDAGVYWSQRAAAALGGGDLDAYLAFVRKAISAQPEVYGPTLSDALLSVARGWRERGDDERHLDFLSQAVEASPLSARLHRLLGDAYWDLGRKEPAVRQYRLVLELEPDSDAQGTLRARILGRDDAAQPSAAKTTSLLDGAVQPVAAANPAARPAGPDVRCPFTGKPVDPQFAVAHRGGTVTFCCAGCRDRFVAEPAASAARANHQLVLTGQARAEKCPFTGRNLDPAIRIDVSGTSVPLCCNGCLSRATQVAGAERIDLLFEDARFAKFFRVDPRGTGAGK